MLARWRWREPHVRTHSGAQRLGVLLAPGEIAQVARARVPARLDSRRRCTSAYWADDACGAAAPHTAQLSTPFAVAREHDAHTQCVRMSSVERDQSRCETTAAPAAATTALEPAVAMAPPLSIAASTTAWSVGGAGCGRGESVVRARRRTGVSGGARSGSGRPCGVVDVEPVTRGRLPPLPPPYPRPHVCGRCRPMHALQAALAVSALPPTSSASAIGRRHSHTGDV